MTPAEYTQLRAFAGRDGFVLSLIWTGSFASYITGLTNPEWSMVGMFLAIVTPFFVAKRLRRFRDEVLDGIISFMRGWAYVIFVFFFAGLLLAMVQYAYFTFVDQGYFIQTFSNYIHTPEIEQLMKQYGITEQLNEEIRVLQSIRAIDLVLNCLTYNILVGVLLGAPIAAFMKSSVRRVDNQQQPSN